MWDDGLHVLVSRLSLRTLCLLVKRQQGVEG